MKKIIFFPFILFLFETPLFSEITFFPTASLSGNAHSSQLRTPSIDVLYAYSAKDQLQYMLYNFGAIIPGILYNNNDLKWEAGGLGGVFTRFKLKSESFNFIHGDFLGGAYFNLKTQSFFFENLFYHISSHIGDDQIYYNNAKVQNTGFEGYKHYTTYHPNDFLFLVLGFEYKFSKRPDAVIFYNKSLYLGNRADFYSFNFPLFFEWEMEWIGIQRSPNIGLRLGIYLKYLVNSLFLGESKKQTENHEFSIYFYNGYSKMGYFYNQRETLLIIGPTFRF